MSDQSPTLADFVQLGELFFHIQNPQAAYVESYLADIPEFLSLLQRCNLVQSLTASKQLDGIKLSYLRRSSRIIPNQVNELTTLTRSIRDTLYEELKTHQVAITKNAAIPEVICDLASRLEVSNLQPHQEALRNDIVQCLNVEAYRPAIVVSWALGFDLLRWWIFSDSKRLDDFNLILEQRTRNKTVRQIIYYSDFFNENESFVLQLCRDSAGSLQKFTGKTFRLLENLLDDRNAFAHANFDNATEHEAKSYIERLFRVLTGSPFTTTERRSEERI